MRTETGERFKMHDRFRIIPMSVCMVVVVVVASVVVFFSSLLFNIVVVFVVDVCVRELLRE